MKKIKIQIAYRYTGEDLTELIEFLKKVCDALNETGYETYCPILNPNAPTGKKELFQDAFKKLDNADAILLIIKSEDKSEGMLLETGYAIAKGKKIILAIKEDVKNTHLRELASKVIEFKNHEELYNKLKSLN